MSWEVWLNDELYEVYDEKWKAELVLDMLDITYPNASKEVKIALT